MHTLDDLGPELLALVLLLPLLPLHAIAAHEDLELDSVDISTVYLNGIMPDEHEVYMKQAEGFRDHGPDGCFA